MFEKLNLDDKDTKILSFFMENPFMSQSEIASNLKLSQPSVNYRIQKLKEKGILNISAGVDFSKTGLVLARVDFTAKNSQKLFQDIKHCAFFVHGFVLSGKNNVSVYFINESLEKIEEIVADNLRSNPDVSDINVNVVVNSVNQFLFKLPLEPHKMHAKCFKPNACATCEQTGHKKIVVRN